MSVKVFKFVILLYLLFLLFQKKYTSRYLVGSTRWSPLTSANVSGTEFYIVLTDLIRTCSIGVHIYDRLGCWLGGKGIVYKENHACSWGSRPWARIGGGSYFVVVVVSLPSFSFLHDFFFSFFTQNKGGQTPPLDPPLSYLCFPLITT